jgi:hypothetical protein
VGCAAGEVTRTRALAESNDRGPAMPQLGGVEAAPGSPLSPPGVGVRLVAVSAARTGFSPGVSWVGVASAPSSIWFAAGSPEAPASSIWKLWHHREKVYLGTRSMLGFIKLSLHSSGNWRVAWTTESGLVAPTSDSGDRVEKRWQPRPN